MQAQAKTAVLLVNLGTPASLGYWAIRRYLAEFLSDTRVVDYPRWLWQPLLQLVILTLRPKRLVVAYRNIWDNAKNQSPLLSITQQQTALLQISLGAKVKVAFAMRYGQPAIGQTLSNLTAAGYTHILICPLYPQYAGATTGTVQDEVARWLLQQTTQPTLRFLPPYYQHPAYIKAICSNKKVGAVATPTLLSFHGLPKRYCQNGDVYEQHCLITAKKIAAALGADLITAVAEIKTQQSKKPFVLTTFQSRFGPEAWLGPSTAETLASLPALGVKNICLITPGFSADCLETLEELDIEARHIFKQAGGQTLVRTPCLNASKVGMDMLHQLISNELQGWVK